MSVSEISIVIIAIALAVQTVLMVVAFAGGLRIWKQTQSDLREMQASLDKRFDAVSSRLDEAIVDARIAARAVEQLAHRADELVQDAAGVAQSVRTAVTVPKALMLTGTASVLKWLVAKWRSGSRKLPAGEHSPDRLGSADVF
jgi:hypothetical protein